MRRELKKVSDQNGSWYYDDGRIIEGPPPDVCGDLTGVCGNLTGVRGNLTGVRGDLTGVCGDLTDCEITPTDRKNGIDITDLISEREKKA